MKNLNITELRGELQGAAVVMHMIVEISCAGVSLSEESRAGLLEVGIAAIGRIESAVAKLGDYDADKAPS